MSSFTESTQAISQELACQSCGALLKFKPGTRHLACEYCGAQNEIAQPEAPGEIREIRLDDFLASHFEKEEQIEVATVKCDGCHAISTFDPQTSSDKCPFCASPLVVRQGTTSRVHKPQYLLPFGVEEKAARQNFARWLKSLWFAPDVLKHYADRADRLAGMYLPYWTFDCQTQTRYTGQRGEDYVVNESYTVVENGHHVTKTRAVTKTRWYSASGTVSNSFDDLLIEATRSLRPDKLRVLEPWDVRLLVPYDDKYLSGFRTETYAVGVKEGYQQAKGRMEPVIESAIRSDIGGDRQTIQYTNVTYQNPTFKHILLPVWISAYRYEGKLYQFLINARTGKVTGDRPYSTMKIALAVIAVILFVAILFFFAEK
jgi:LSD1 subclass zinc finger protein